MNKQVRQSMFRSLGFNFLAGLIGMLPFTFLGNNAVITWGFILIGIAILSLLIQLIIGIVYSGKPQKREKGQGMLLSVGIIFLIGVAVCTPFWI